MLDKLPTSWRYRVEDAAYAVTSWVRQPTRRINGLREIETGLALFVRDITNPPEVGQLVPPITAYIERSRFPKIGSRVSIEHSNTSLQAEAGKFSVIKTYGALRHSITFQKNTVQKTTLHFASSCGGQPFITELRWYHFRANKYARMIRNHITTIANTAHLLPLPEDSTSVRLAEPTHATLNVQPRRAGVYPKIVAIASR